MNGKFVAVVDETFEDFEGDAEQGDKAIVFQIPIDLCASGVVTTRDFFQILGIVIDIDEKKENSWPGL